MDDVQKLTRNEVLALNKINLDGKADDFSANPFCHYSSIDKVDNILSSNHLWASSIAEMNDLNEINLHSKDRDRVHVLSFCNSKTEKIPLWYLYGGICGTGMRIKITPANMRDFIKSIDIVYPVKDGQPDEKKPLMVGEEIELQYGWIYYREKEEGKIKHKGKKYEISGDIFEEEENYFVKDYSWNFEGEFRIVLINNTDIKYERLAVKIPEKVKASFGLMYAPEVEQRELVFEKKGIKELLLNKIDSSNLGIRMDLLKRNEEDIMRYVRDEKIEEIKEILSY